MNNAPIIVWLRRDLRIADNPALSAAAETGMPVIPLYIYETDTGREIGAAQRVWLSEGLKDIARTLKSYGVDLIVRLGRANAVLDDIIQKTGARAVYWNRRYSQDGRDCDAAIKGNLKVRNINAQSFKANLLSEPWEVKTKAGGYYKVFTPYWRAARNQVVMETPLSAPAHIEPYQAHLKSDELDIVGAGNVKGRPWPEIVLESWQISEKAAQGALGLFLTGSLSSYDEGRDFPAKNNGTSKLSPYLAMGQISPRQVWHAAQSASYNPDKFLSEIGWREFSYSLLFYNPDLAKANFKAEYNAFPWDGDELALERWQKGQTGYPFVDAGMRQLWQTGWQHNRVRMICASFLIKHLLLDWRAGEAWYWDTLFDADPASNAASWQWVAGSGADASPYFRIFNPITQGEKFDPEAAYIRQWVPELGLLPTKYIHRPWEAPVEALEMAGVVLGQTYPKPMVDHKFARERALQAYKTMRGGE